MSSKDTFTAEVPKEIKEDSCYNDWEENLDGSLLPKVVAAREKIASDGVITSAKDLGEGLYEKKWNSGLRLYFAVVIESDGNKTLLLLGSGKGRDQDKAIQQSRDNLKNYSVFNDSIVKKD
ncbi:hypothetical protein CIK05_10820 [Bdellovibrio sp. qaytius]|nr:hypothetical protein CIK05_10820 [Bdellovibrio sp. qaytius]